MTCVGRASSLFLILTCSSLSAQQILVRPYLQPGNAPDFTREQKVIIWQTDSVPVSFTARSQLKGRADWTPANVSSVELHLSGKGTRLYRAVADQLLFDTLYYYEVAAGDRLIARDSFHTRTTKPFTRFAVFGDFGEGSRQQAAVAYQVSLTRPQFVVTTGDNVYENGLEEEYRSNFFPYYLSAKTGSTTGASLMNSIPFYMILGNHDIRAGNLAKKPGGFAFYYYSDLPLNAPVTAKTAEVKGKGGLAKAFRQNTKPRFPRMSNYSFDYGNVHVTCLDANEYVNPLDADLVTWLKRDIGKSAADWKIVACHNAGFQSSRAHYDEQAMRLLAPLFEKLGVDLVLAGHVHNYQRSAPLKFAPEADKSTGLFTISKEGRVNGTFTIDRAFDGDKVTVPNGIIYIVTGAGGGGLYDRELTDKPELWTHDPTNWANFTVKLVSDRHSFTLIETHGKKLTLRQIDLAGREMDKIVVEK